MVLPKNRPIITGGRNSYRSGDLVDVNCTSAASKPAAKIRWFINDKKANANYIRQYKAASGDDGLETTVLGLTFEVHDAHLQDDGKLSLRCVASVGPTHANFHHNQYQYQSNNNSPLPPDSLPISTVSSAFERNEIVAPSEHHQQHFYNPIIETMSMVSEVRFEGIFSLKQ